MLTCTLYKAHDLPPSEIAYWRDLAAVTPDFASPLLSPDFMQAVAQVRDDVYVAVYRRGAQTIGFLAHHRRPNRFARPVGAPFSDYCAIITAPDPGFTIAQALELAGIDRFHVAGIVDPYGIFGEPIANATPEDAYAIDLRDDEPGNNVVKKLAKNINRLRRQLADQVGEPRFIIGDDNRRHFDAMIDLKRAQVRQTGLHDFLAAPWVQRLMDNLMAAPKDGLHGCLVTLMAGDTPLMYQFGPRLADRAHPWISSYDPAFGAYSPGQIFLNDCRMPLKEAGISWYDLSTGQQHYKPAFCNHHSIVHNAMVFSSSPAGRFKQGFLKAGRRLQRAIRPVDHLLNRIDRRMDVIASLELDTVARLRGFTHAVVTAPKRKGSSDA
ncbi:hypothetical protein ABI_09210 [Asticcacaulis biprosthecium C19]|uniref:BioF2-like acetyltransferase domain-containing protein n=1 Tax=Asticcacaulis biprosthecium C19 TaxID=715226 RepID=F4QGN2_9CAUL|nr:GNAT family N-acetyltransferase [Asticcacaulis biprosthecium]EGF92484.1 hypothetical protein ABI_09210 [Asticcacaulis biprosthecium C19]